MLAVLTAAVIALVVKAFVLDAAVVDGRSMLPLLRPGSVVLVLRCAYGIRSPASGGYLLRWASPGRGDVVVAVDPMNGRTVVKRTAAVGPLRLEAKGSELHAAGIEIPLDEEGARRWQSGLSLRDGQLFLMGDNPPESMDSRSYGPVDAGTLRGKVLLLPEWIRR